MSVQEMENLPEEVVEEILSRLPVEFLLQFKCVCKSWYALFKNPNFVSKHLIHQSKDNVILQRYCPNKGNIFCCLSDFGNIGNGGDSFFSIEDLNLGLDLKLPKHRTGRSLRMTGHCNGIVALSDFDEEVILCNPALREFRFLPKSCFHPFPKYVSRRYREPDSPIYAETNGLGFGYDPKTDDYKVVRIVAFWKDSRLPNKAEVFSLRADSTWREVKDVDIGADPWSDDLDQFFDGVYYWQTQNMSTNKMTLVSFNMADEVFSKAPLPDFCNCDYTRCLMQKLGVFNNESIAMFVYFSCDRGTCIKVWVMEEFGRKDSWTKQLTIGPLLEGIESPLVFWKSDEELLLEDFKGQLMSYNLATRKSKSPPIHGGDLHSWTATTYKKTLVSVNGGNDTTIAMNKRKLGKTRRGKQLDLRRLRMSNC